MPSTPSTPTSTTPTSEPPVLPTEEHAPIVNPTSNTTTNIDNVAVVQTTQGETADGSDAVHTTFITTDTTADPNITVDLGQVVVSYEENDNTPSGAIVREIQSYADKIKCESFKGKGTIEDYNELFVAASKIVNETKQMRLEVDLDGFNEFGAAADELSSLFEGFIIKLQNVNIIDDLVFLNTVLSAMKRISNLVDMFGRFKETIIATATVKIPKSSHTTRLIVQDVVSNLNCAMDYVNYFVNPTVPIPEQAALSATEKTIISAATSTIENWRLLCEQDLTISMANNPDVVAMKQFNQQLSLKSAQVRNNVLSLRAKLSQFRNL
jgi:hypothetical protein